MKFIKDLQALKAVPFTHATLKSILSKYKNPNDKIQQMVRAGEIIRIKRSLYVLGEIYNQVSVSKELLANLIYGPSYVSLDYALSYYNLIPERVFEITSVTTKIAKNYHTPLGRFSYIKSPNCIYAKAIKIKTNSDGVSYMLASPEKALCDKILLTQNLKITSIKAMIEYLEYDLRIDFYGLVKFDLELIKQCMGCNYKVKLLDFLYKALQKIRIN
jgi:hypothetical protein